MRKDVSCYMLIEIFIQSLMGMDIYTFREDNSQLFCLPSEMGLLFKERICFLGSRFFCFRVTLSEGAWCTRKKESKQEDTKVVFII